jgi:hypothetical protein
MAGSAWGANVPLRDRWIHSRPPLGVQASRRFATGLDVLPRSLAESLASHVLPLR